MGSTAAAVAATPSGVTGEFAGLSVVDSSSGIAGGYCAKLLGDAGADVVLIEPPDGHPLRRWACGTPLEPGEDGALFRYLRHGHGSVVDGPATAAMIAGADV